MEFTDRLGAISMEFTDRLGAISMEFTDTLGAISMPALRVYAVLVLLLNTRDIVFKAEHRGLIDLVKFNVLFSAFDRLYC